MKSTKKEYGNWTLEVGDVDLIITNKLNKASYQLWEKSNGWIRQTDSQGITRTLYTNGEIVKQ